MNKNDILFTVSHVFSLHTLHTIICIILWGMKIYSMTCITSETHSGCPLHPSNFSRRFMFQYFMHLHCPSLETSWNCVGSLCYKAHAFSTDSTVQLGNACLVSDVLWHGLWCIIEWPQWVNWMWLFWDKPFVWHSSQTKPSKDLLYNYRRIHGGLTPFQLVQKLQSPSWNQNIHPICGCNGQAPLFDSQELWTLSLVLPCRRAQTPHLVEISISPSFYVWKKKLTWCQKFLGWTYLNTMRPWGYHSWSVRIKHDKTIQNYSWKAINRLQGYLNHQWHPEVSRKNYFESSPGRAHWPRRLWQQG